MNIPHSSRYSNNNRNPNRSYTYRNRQQTYTMQAPQNENINTTMKVVVAGGLAVVGYLIIDAIVDSITDIIFDD